MAREVVLIYWYREAVHTLKCPIRGRERRQSIMMDTWYIKG
jgi:hypothetical protein